METATGTGTPDTADIGSCLERAVGIGSAVETTTPARFGGLGDLGTGECHAAPARSSGTLQPAGTNTSALESSAHLCLDAGHSQKKPPSAGTGRRRKKKRNAVKSGAKNIPELQEAVDGLIAQLDALNVAWEYPELLEQPHGTKYRSVHGPKVILVQVKSVVSVGVSVLGTVYESHDRTAKTRQRVGTPWAEAVQGQNTLPCPCSGVVGCPYHDHSSRVAHVSWVVGCPAVSNTMVHRPDTAVF